jgi:hypothetical protein
MGGIGLLSGNTAPNIDDLAHRVIPTNDPFHCPLLKSALDLLQRSTSVKPVLNQNLGQEGIYDQISQPADRNRLAWCSCWFNSPHRFTLSVHLIHNASDRQ